MGIFIKLFEEGRMIEEKGVWFWEEKWEYEVYGKYMGKVVFCLEFVWKRIYVNGCKFCLCWIENFKWEFY